jgi:glycosyltransferase involved in cell wall biosynthesis
MALAGTVAMHEFDVEQPVFAAHLTPQNLHALPAGTDLLTSVGTTGLVFELDRLWLGRPHLRAIRAALSSAKPVWLYWRDRGVVERIGRRGLMRLHGVWAKAFMARRLLRTLSRPTNSNNEPDTLPNSAWDDFETSLQHFIGGETDFIANLSGLSATRQDAEIIAQAIPAEAPDDFRIRVERLVESLTIQERIQNNFSSYLGTGTNMLKRFRTNVVLGGMDGRISALDVPVLIKQMERLTDTAVPVPMHLPHLPSPEHPNKGTGLYLRMDFWAPMISGGSYGHTCFVAKELRHVSDDLLCITGNHFPLLDEMGLRQIVVRPNLTQYSDLHILAGAEYYLTALTPLVNAVRPTYIYERLCLGNTTAARLSREFGIPYILEYNGSEISLKRSFDGNGYEQEAAFLAAERLSFAQATMITVVSDHIRNDLISRGVNPDKIMVNPNAVDSDEYKPMQPALRHKLRTELGFTETDCVVGFIGTFGGWHGIDVLAASLKPILDAAPNVQFLLIGDGNLRHLVDAQVTEHRLSDRVKMTGRVKQTDGARLLGACDIYVSPHSRHMVDGKFFGSPTKLFEYLAMGGAIIASELEQLGVVMAPSLRPHHLRDASLKVEKERGVLCKPGDLDDFISAVVGLAARPDLWGPLGTNARQAAIDHYSWRSHVENDFRHIRGEPLIGHSHDFSAKHVVSAKAVL